MAVVGAGPNGLTAAVTLARSGLSVHVVEGHDSIGGGTRTTELTLPGYLHDVCSAVHPLAVASPAYRRLGLEQHGLEWIDPPIAAAHPLEGKPAALLHRDILQTAAALDRDAAAYRRLMEPLVGDASRLVETVLRPLFPVPRHIGSALRFGRVGMSSAAAITARFDEDPARALIGGMAAHSISPLDSPMTAAVALLLMTLGHHVGWPFARGGSHQITRSLAAALQDAGGTIETGRWIEHRDECDAAAVLLDVMPAAAARIVGGDTMATRGLRRWKHGPGAFKLDWVLDGPIPWADPRVLGAGTVHVGGTFEEIAFAESTVAAGNHPDRPFVIVTQPSRFDRSRAPEGHEVVWGYCHVPAGSSHAMTGPIEAQIERFAPGFSDRIIARHAINAGQYEAYNPNNVGGDVAGGATTMLQTLFRPRPALHPYRISDDVYLCSASTPPGAGSHGMSGYNSAQAFLAGRHG